MDARKNNKPKRPYNPVMEWISDNLRYFMLIGAFLLLILITAGVVKLISGKKNSAEGSSLQTVAESVTGSSDSKSAEQEHAAAELTPIPAAVSAEADNEAENAVVREEDTGSIPTLIRAYFQGLSARDPETVRACVDTLSQEDAQQVTDNTQITGYQDVEVYTCDGMDEQSKVAFVSYLYTVDGSDAEIPALTQFYVYDRGDGDWRLASEITDTAVQNRIQELTQTEEVQAMIHQVQTRYDQVMTEHPELQ